MANSIGIDVGGTKILGAVVDQNGNIVDEYRMPTPRGVPALVSAIDEVVKTVYEKCPDNDLPATLGIGVPGPVDNGGHLFYTPNIPDVRDVTFAEVLSPPADMFIYTGNDANVAAWGERTHGAGVGKDNVVIVTLGTGIGGGVIVEGKLMTGFHGYANEIGHMIVDPYGPHCTCGQRGCWERYGSGSGLARLAREEAQIHPTSRMVELAGGDTDLVNGEQVVAAAREGDEVALGVVNRFARWVAIGLSSLSNIFDPEYIIIGGGMIDAADVILEPIRTQFLQSKGHPETEVVAAKLGENAGVVGAADLARFMAMT